MACGLVLLAAALLAHSAVLAAIAGPHKLVLRGISPCVKEEAGDTGDDVTVNCIIHYNRTIKGNIGSANLTIKNNVFTSGATSIIMDVAKWDSVSGWRQHFMMMPLGDACFAIQDVGIENFNLIRSYSTPNLPKKCPLPNGHFVFRGVPVRLNGLRHFPTMPYGKFRVHILGMYTKQPSVKRPRLCIKMLVDTIPRV